METQLLQTFLTVAETGSISAAADRLGYVQSSVSDQVRRLERELGVTLLTRTSTGVSPTAEGRRLVPDAERVLAALDELRRTTNASRPRRPRPTRCAGSRGKAPAGRCCRPWRSPTTSPMAGSWSTRPRPASVAPSRSSRCTSPTRAPTSTASFAERSTARLLPSRSVDPTLRAAARAPGTLAGPLGGRARARGED